MELRKCAITYTNAINGLQKKTNPAGSLALCPSRCQVLTQRPLGCGQPLSQPVIHSPMKPEAWKHTLQLGPNCQKTRDNARCSSRTWVLTGLPKASWLHVDPTCLTRESTMTRWQMHTPEQTYYDAFRQKSPVWS